MVNDQSKDQNWSEQVQAEQDERAHDDMRYSMRISRRTVEKLGVKLYDRVSAVVAELVANAYDADAETVRVRVPLSSLLGHQNGAEHSIDIDGIPDGQPSTEATEKTEVIEIIDDGHGMDPTEADLHFLTIGQDRRINPEQGALSREKRRHVTGRKGIGKLASFGICNRIEVLSAGGSGHGGNGYQTSHFILDYKEIIQDTEKTYHPKRGRKDRSTSCRSGTTIRLSGFQRKRVPNQETFLRQLARRFGSQQSGFRIVVDDIHDPSNIIENIVSALDIPVVEQTRIDLQDRPVQMEDGVLLNVTGWVGLAKTGYKHEELAGIRIYARNKIVASTRDFGLMSGFTGEHTLRSYLVGEIHAEWLDEDEGEDLIKTDRQDIIWESDRGQALKKWGWDLLREVGQRSRIPRREIVRTRFLQISNFESRARQRYTDNSVIETALDLAQKIGGFAAEDELEDDQYVDELCDVILSVAPHRALMDAFREFRKQINPDAPSLDTLSSLFDKTRVAELASYSQIAAERVTILGELSRVVEQGSPEPQLQALISKGPWLIDPSWSVITNNQSLRTFARSFASLWEQEHGESIAIAMDNETTRPDFTALEVGGKLRVIEIKRPKHALNADDFERLQNYVVALRNLFERNESTSRAFGNGWQIDLVVDDVSLQNESQRESFSSYQQKKELVQITWEDFIARAEQSHAEFLDVYNASNQEQTG